MINLRTKTILNNNDKQQRNHFISLSVVSHENSSKWTSSHYHSNINLPLLTWDGPRNCETEQIKKMAHEAKSLFLLEVPMTTKTDVSIVSNLEKKAQFHLITLEHEAKADMDAHLIIF